MVPIGGTFTTGVDGSDLTCRISSNGQVQVVTIHV